MTSYSFSGLLVDVKAYNWHMSALPDTTLNNNYNTVATTIPVGSIVIPGTTLSGSVDNAGDSAVNYLGVATETRNAADSRPLTYTWAGVVRVITDNSTITVGGHLACGAEGKVKSITETTMSGHHNIAFGRALEASAVADETIIMAYINMAH